MHLSALAFSLGELGRIPRGEETGEARGSLAMRGHGPGGRASVQLLGTRQSRYDAKPR